MALLDNNFAESYAESSLAGVYEEDHDCSYACDLVIACFSVCLRWLDQMRDAERSAASAAYASRFFVDARWFVVCCSGWCSAQSCWASYSVAKLERFARINMMSEARENDLAAVSDNETRSRSASRLRNSV